MIKNIIYRLKLLLKMEKDGELADAMGVNQTTFSSWKHRDTIDFNILIDFCRKNNISLDWLFEFETQNAISEPKTQYETENIPKIDNLEARIKILENYIKNQIKE